MSVVNKPQSETISPLSDESSTAAPTEKRRLSRRRLVLVLVLVVAISTLVAVFLPKLINAARISSARNSLIGNMYINDDYRSLVDGDKVIIGASTIGWPVGKPLIKLESIKFGETDAEITWSCFPESYGRTNGFSARVSYTVSIESGRLYLRVFSKSSETQRFAYGYLSISGDTFSIELDGSVHSFTKVH